MEKLYKVILLGDTNTGKTSIIKRYIDNSFIEAHFVTPLPIASTKRFNDSTGNYQLAIWDTAGSEDWQSMNSTVYHGSIIVIFIASFDQKDSIKSLVTTWLNRIAEYESTESFVPFIAINKSDLIGKPECQISESECDNAKKDLNVDDDHIFNVSAKEDLKIKELFEAVALAAREFDLRNNPDPGLSTELPKKLGKEEDNKKNNKDASCC